MTDVEDIQALGKVLVNHHRDFLLELVVQALQQVMESEVTALTGAAKGARSEDRLTHRNGYRPRSLETRLGTADLAIPKLRKGSYLPSFIEPRRRWEKAFVNVVSEAYVLGVSTRKVEDLVAAMGAQGMSKSEVSRMARHLDAQVRQFRERPLGARSYPYVWLDALYVKVRDNGHVVSKAVLVAYGVSDLGEREVLGIHVALSEMEASWRVFLEDLVKRGLRGVQLVISDAHSGLRAAIRTVLNGTTWQRCIVHFLRNVLSKIPRNAQDLISATVRNVFRQPTPGDAKAAVGKAIELLQTKWPAAAELLGNAEEDVLAYMRFPDQHWRQIKSTNPLERLNREIRRRTDVVGIFPNDASILRLVTMLLVEQNDEWAVGRRYFSFASMALVTGAADVPPRALEAG
jgi:transposase-like protein